MYMQNFKTIVKSAFEHIVDLEKFNLLSLKFLYYNHGMRT